MFDNITYFILINYLTGDEKISIVHFTQLVQKKHVLFYINKPSIPTIHERLILIRIDSGALKITLNDPEVYLNKTQLQKN